LLGAHVLFIKGLRDGKRSGSQVNPAEIFVHSRKVYEEHQTKRPSDGFGSPLLAEASYFIFILSALI